MSGIGTGMAIAGAVGAAGSLGAGALEAGAAGKAASAQEAAAEKAAGIQGQLGQESLSNEVQTQEQNQANEKPWLQTGANGLAQLAYMMGIAPGGTVGGGTATPGQSLSIPGVNGSVNMPGVTPLTGTADSNIGRMGSLMQAYPGGEFTAPTAAQAAEEPGYKFALNQGEGAVEAGAAANGSLLTGGTLNAEQQFGQGLASTNYTNVYNRALQTYGTNYNTWSNGQANQFNRLAAIAGMGQTSAQTLGAQGLQSSGQIANTLTNTGEQLGQDFQNEGAARASGYVGSANAWGGGISGAANSLSRMMMLQQMMNGGNAYKTLYNAQNPDRSRAGGTGDPTLSGYQIPNQPLLPYSF